MTEIFSLDEIAEMRMLADQQEKKEELCVEHIITEFETLSYDNKYFALSRLAARIRYRISGVVAEL